VYQRLRATLVKELGLEPSARLHRLQHSLLVSTPAAGGSAAAAARVAGTSGGSGPSVPPQGGGHLVHVD